MKPVTLGEVEELAHFLAIKLMSWDEPIPPFSTRRPGILEGCLLAPMATFDSKKLYPTLVSKAAILFYVMIKDHPFMNGNKRLAVTTLMVFVDKNDHWITVDEEEMYNFAKWVAASNPKVKAETVNAIQSFIRAYMSKNDPKLL